MADRCLSVHIVAKRLDIAERTVIRLIHSGQLSAHKIGKQYRILEEDYKKYLQSTLIQSDN